MTAGVRVRFAPSPTGYLHVGSARAVLFNWLFARRAGGEFLLRIEDTDESRNRPELVDDLLAGIAWLGLDDWDGDVVHQSARRPRHLEAAEQLVADGAAFWSGWAPDNSGGGRPERRAPDRDAGLGPGEGRALRFRVPDDGGATSFHDLIRGTVSVAHEDIEDFVLVRANGTPMFLLANAVDDADMGITHVLRGEEHLPGTPKHILIQAAVGASEPPTFAHLPILVDEHRKKLSKRKHAVAVSDFRDRGILPEAMINALALLGWGPPEGVAEFPLSLPELVPLFRLEDVTPSPAFFDERKLEAINGEWIRALGGADFTSRALPWVEGDAAVAALRALAPLAQSRLRRLDQLPATFDWVDGPADDEAAWEKVARQPFAAEAVAQAVARWTTVEWEVEAMHADFNALAESLGIAPRKLDAPLRVAVTGRTVGLPLFDVCVYLGRDEVLARLRTASERFRG